MTPGARGVCIAYRKSDFLREIARVPSGEQDHSIRPKARVARDDRYAQRQGFADRYSVAVGVGWPDKDVCPREERDISFVLDLSGTSDAVGEPQPIDEALKLSVTSRTHDDTAEPGKPLAQPANSLDKERKAILRIGCPRGRDQGRKALYQLGVFFGEWGGSGHTKIRRDNGQSGIPNTETHEGFANLSIDANDPGKRRDAQPYEAARQSAYPSKVGWRETGVKSQHALGTSQSDHSGSGSDHNPALRRVTIGVKVKRRAGSETLE